MRRSVDWKRFHIWPGHTAGRRPVGAHTFCATVRAFLGMATLGLLALVTVLLEPSPLAAASIPVRFPEGVTHGFLVLGTVDGVVLASGDLLQAARDGKLESRMVFRFKDGSVFDETAVFTQQGVFTLQSYHLVQRGPAFPEDTEIELARASGAYRVKTKARTDGREKVLEGKLDLPPDVYNGMVLIVAKNLPKRGQRDRPHRGVHARAPAHPAETRTGGRAQGVGR